MASSAGGAIYKLKFSNTISVIVGFSRQRER